MSRLAVLLLLCFGSEQLYAQSQAVTATSSIFANSSLMTNSSLATLTKRVDEVGLILTITDNKGRLVRNLTPADLTILDNNQAPDRITYFQSQTDLPLRVALVVDTSDSVTRRFRFEQEAAAAFLRRILRPDSDLAFVIGFNQQVHLAQATTDDTNLLSKGLHGLQIGGETAVYDAVSTACHELVAIKDTQPTRRAIILITDGEDNHSQIGLEDAVATALRSETVVYALSTNPEVETPAFDEGDKALVRLSQATGGRLLRAENEVEVRKAFTKLEKELRSQYALGYKPVNPIPDGLFHRLTVFGPKKLHVYHRQGYYAR